MVVVVSYNGGFVSLGVGEGVFQLVHSVFLQELIVHGYR